MHRAQASVPPLLLPELRLKVAWYFMKLRGRNALALPPGKRGQGGQSHVGLTVWCQILASGGVNRIELCSGRDIRDARLDLWVRKTLWRSNWKPTSHMHDVKSYIFYLLDWWLWEFISLSNIQLSVKWRQKWHTAKIVVSIKWMNTQRVISTPSPSLEPAKYVV